MRIPTTSRLTQSLLICIGLLVLASPAFAQLPWEDAMEVLGSSMTAVGFWIGVIGFIAAGAIMAFGNDLSDVGRRAVVATMGVSIVLLAQDFIGILFG